MKHDKLRYLISIQNSNRIETLNETRIWHKKNKNRRLKKKHYRPVKGGGLGLGGGGFERKRRVIINSCLYIKNAVYLHIPRKSLLFKCIAQFKVALDHFIYIYASKIQNLFIFTGFTIHNPISKKKEIESQKDARYDIEDGLRFEVTHFCWFGPNIIFICKFLSLLPIIRPW